MRGLAGLILSPRTKVSALIGTAMVDNQHHEGMPRCECADSNCPAHQATPFCREGAVTTLYRIDLRDQRGIYFCADCAADALDSGVYTTIRPD
jgi:hypothetical protein